jgi:hypothetical protein
MVLLPLAVQYEEVRMTRPDTNYSTRMFWTGWYLLMFGLGLGVPTFLKWAGVSICIGACV